MANKKQNKISGNLWLFLSVIGSVVLIIFLTNTVLKNNRAVTQPDKDNKIPGLSVIDATRSLEVLSVNQDGYTARDANTGEEVIVVVPESADIMLLSGSAIKAGDIIVLQKYVKAANGLIASQLQVLPSVPRDKPTALLPDNPNE